MSQAKKIPESEIPEVAAFLEAKERLDNLKAAYPEVFEQLDMLKETYNSTLEAAEKAVRARKVSCGPFDMYQTQTKYDAEKLYEEVGRDRFLEVGGIIKTEPTFEINKAKLEAQIAANAFPKEALEVFRKITPFYKKPDKISI